MRQSTLAISILAASLSTVAFAHQGMSKQQSKAKVTSTSQGANVQYSPMKHWVLDAGVGAVHYNARLLTSYGVTSGTSQGGSELISDGFAWAPNYHAALGYLFSNHSFASGLMGKENKLSLGFSFSRAIESSNLTNSTGGANNDYLTTITGTFRLPIHVNTLDVKGRYYVREFDLNWSGKIVGSNNKLNVTPTLGLVYNWQTVSTNRNLYYNRSGTFFTDISNAHQSMRFYGVGFGEKVDFSFNRYASVNAGLKVQGLEGRAKFNATEQVISGGPVLSASGHDNFFTDRELLSLGFRLNFTNQPNTPYLSLSGGTEHWGKFPVFAKLGNANEELHYTEASVWNPYIGLTLTVPLV